ncbi:MAG TPA: cytochrome C [Campylobacteraceae bacterium]|nr:cytochrome C [Campylobacteraceae bacterium]
MRKILAIFVLLLILIQLIRPERTNPATEPKETLHADPDVMKILKRSCYDCHSNETKWPWYSNIAPLSWSIISHVNDGRKALNFSHYVTIDPKIKEKRLKRLIKTTRNGMMPLPSYLWIHKDALVSSAEKERLEKWANSELKKLHSEK